MNAQSPGFGQAPVGPPTLILLAKKTFSNISLKTAVIIAPQPPILGEHELNVTHLLLLCKEILISPTVSTLGDFQTFVPPRIGGLGGRNHTQNQQRLQKNLITEVISWSSL
ncbi:hypothetical protein BJP34_12525 [Moorena producens PAL-8-15-08-1]|uniref:Uncharacterized protein n=1 Tax=Moorena producens PAL-8-15-08-1 TaxID=1458985 RepID=A0A1D8TRC9_9CYAN|nr:hypothetical protein BJP34_12525 [Moorena producens PAL-8-15-08-1]